MTQCAFNTILDLRYKKKMLKVMAIVCFCVCPCVCVCLGVCVGVLPSSPPDTKDHIDLSFSLPHTHTGTHPLSPNYNLSSKWIQTTYSISAVCVCTLCVCRIFWLSTDNQLRPPSIELEAFYPPILLSVSPLLVHPSPALRQLVFPSSDSGPRLHVLVLTDTFFFFHHCAMNVMNK